MQIHCSSTNNLPEELQCKKCMDLLCDAVVLPCCGNSTCERCVKDCWSPDGMCSWCETPGCSIAQVIPNMQLRQAVENYISESGYRPNKCVAFGDIVSTSVSNAETCGLLMELTYESQAIVKGQPSPTILPLEGSLPIPQVKFDCEIACASVDDSCVTSMDTQSKLSEALTVDALPEITDSNSSAPFTIASLESTTISSTVDTSATCSVSNSNEYSENCKENTLPTDSVPNFDPQFYYNQAALVNYHPMYLYPQASYGYGQSVYPFGFPMPPVPPPYFPQRWLNEHEFYKLQLHMRESHNKFQGYYGRSHQSSLWKTSSKHSSRHNQPKRNHHKAYSKSPSVKKSRYDSDTDGRQSRSSSNHGYPVSYLKNSSQRDIRKYPYKTSSKYYKKHSSVRPGEFYSSRYQSQSRKDYYKHSSGSKGDRYRRHSKSSTRRSRYRSRSRSFSKERSREYIKKRRNSASAQSSDDESSENNYKESQVSKKEDKSYSSGHSSRSYRSQSSIRDDELRGSSVSKFQRSSRSKSSIRRKNRKGGKKHKKAKSSARHSRHGSRSESESRDDRRQAKSSYQSSSDCCSDDQSKSRSSGKEGRFELCLESSKSNGYKDQSVVDASDDIEISKHSKKRSGCRVAESRSRSRDSVTSDCNNGNKRSLEASAESHHMRHSGSPFSTSDFSDQNPGKKASKSALRFLEHEEKSTCKAADNRDIQNKNGFLKCRSPSKSSSPSDDGD